MIGTSAIVTIPFISASCGGPEDGDKYIIFATGSSKQEIVAKIKTNFLLGGREGELNALHKTYSYPSLTNLELISYSSRGVDYWYIVDGGDYHYESPDNNDTPLSVNSFSFFKKINENSSLYSFNIAIGGIAGEGICYYDTMHGYHDSDVFYVNYTGTGTL